MIAESLFLIKDLSLDLERFIEVCIEEKLSERVTLVRHFYSLLGQFFLKLLVNSHHTK
jgi:hypothetical protein